MPKLPGINHERAVKTFEKAGFWIARQGKHITMTNGERIISGIHSISPKGHSSQRGSFGLQNVFPTFTNSAWYSLKSWTSLLSDV